MYDRTRSEYGYMWRNYNHHQTINCDALVPWPEADEIIRHPRILPASEGEGQRGVSSRHSHESMHNAHLEPCASLGTFLLKKGAKL